MRNGWTRAVGEGGREAGGYIFILPVFLNYVPHAL